MSYQPWSPTQVPNWWEVPITPENTADVQDWLDARLAGYSVKAPSMPENTGPLPEQKDLPGSIFNQGKVKLGNLLSSRLLDLANVNSYNAMQNATYGPLQQAGIQGSVYNPYSAALLQQSTPFGQEELSASAQGRVASAVQSDYLNKLGAARQMEVAKLAPGTVRSYYDPNY
tara:strand:+ start:871 stop:1386 length:516 start_codon:yes stop_codon:yes gene_type:complete